jgi:hypothetical protein
MSKSLKNLRFSLAGNKANVLEQFAPIIFMSILWYIELHDRSKLVRTYASELLELV